ncbi:MAG: hypothetical protein IJW49_08935 [Clostridia bacterium]|nr:hypothetical protein [Clostridia bacterium]
MRKKKETGRHRSMLDLFLILMLSVCLVGGGVRAYGLRTVASTPIQQSILVELQSDGVDGQSASCLTKGELLYLSDGTVFGTVTEVRSVPLTVTLIANGTSYHGEWDSARRCRIQITVECAGSMKDGMFLFLGKTPLGIGETLSLLGDRSELLYRIQGVIS